MSRNIGNVRRTAVQTGEARDQQRINRQTRLERKSWDKRSGR